ncbi:MAG: hypothetical protein Q8934_18125 [Bacillota bacterium]|nr:hypothetical protein [Bacillota bacterium]
MSSGPVIPYGSTIITDNQITMPGDPTGLEDTFYVEDLGDLINTRGLTRYWFDIYYGPDDGSKYTLNQNEKNAATFGNTLITNFRNRALSGNNVFISWAS